MSACKPLHLTRLKRLLPVMPSYWCSFGRCFTGVLQGRQPPELVTHEAYKPLAQRRPEDYSGSAGRRAQPSPSNSVRRRRSSDLLTATVCCQKSAKYVSLQSTAFPWTLRTATLYYSSQQLHQATAHPLVRKCQRAPRKTCKVAF